MDTFVLCVHKIFSIKMDEIFIYFAKIDHSNLSKNIQFYTNLDELEFQRILSYRVEKDKHHFILSRYILKYLIAQLYQVAEKEVRLTSSPSGKLALVGIEPSIYFSISHSDEFLAFALSKNCPVGIDIEKFRILDKDLIQNRSIFSHRERNDLSQSENYQQEIIYLWTLKESYLKIIGSGIVDEELNLFEFQRVGPNREQIQPNLSNLSGQKNEMYFQLYLIDKLYACAIAICSQKRNFKISLQRLDFPVLFTEYSIQKLSTSVKSFKR